MTIADLSPCAVRLICLWNIERPSMTSFVGVQTAVGSSILGLCKGHLCDPFPPLSLKHLC